MDSIHHKSLFQCPECGSLVMAYSSNKLCDYCKQDRIREKNARARHRNYVNTTKHVVVLFDPVPPEKGGYPRGAEFEKWEFDLGLPRGNWSEGMILNMRGKTVKIIHGQCKPMEA